MSNMPYCRFQNTSPDLDSCYYALYELLKEDAPLSPEELRAAKRLANTCHNIVLLLAESIGSTVDGLVGNNLEEALDDANRAAQEAS